METWQLLLKQVEQGQPVAASPYFSGKLLAWSGGRIKLGYAPESFELSLARQRQRLETFQRECARYTGSPVTVETVELGEHQELTGAGISALEDHERARRERAERLRSEARAHPITKLVVEEFEATIESITTEADEP
jgi:hypothetical protein